MTHKVGDDSVRDLVALGNKLWNKRTMLEQLWQSIAEEFYPERADFTRERLEGEEFARHLAESQPAQNRRDLASAMGAILRPRGQPWFKPMPTDEWRKTDGAKAWLSEKGEVMRSFIYNRSANFRQAWWEGDNDFVSFGNSVSSLTENRNRSGFLFMTYHLRDCVWAQDEEHRVNVMHRKFKRSLANIAQRWGREVIAPGLRDKLEKDPHFEIELRHVVLPREQWHVESKELRKSNKPFLSFYIDPAQNLILECNGYFEFPYLVRRWGLFGNSQYAFSPAAMLSLCDARLLQAQAHTIQDAGELAVRPPMAAQAGAIIDNVVNGYAGGITWIDSDYDERNGAALRAIELAGKINLGLDMKVDTRNILAAAWYLNKLNLPSDKDMTAYEVSERISEYIRSVGPVFEPFEVDNAQMLDLSWSILWRISATLQAGGKFGPFGDLTAVPEELSEAEVSYEFDTPVQQAYARMKANKFREGATMAGELSKVKPDILDNIDFDTGVRESLEGLGWDPRWLKPKKVVDAERQQRGLEAAKAQQMQQLQGMADAAGKASRVVPALAQATGGDLSSLFAGAEDAEFEEAAE